MVGDGLEDELGGRLLWESIPVKQIQVRHGKQQQQPMKEFLTVFSHC